MRKIEYLSPSALALFDKNEEEYYLKYLADIKPPPFLQTLPMSIGSAFDAYVKNYLHERLFGVGNDLKYALDTIFEAQVESQHRDWAKQNGKYAFEQYKQAGALADLLLELQKAKSTPRFEFEVKGAVNGYREGVESTIHEVTLLGKPDVHFVNTADHHVILDFKVNGYCSKAGASPNAGYLRMRSAGATNLGMHKNCQPMMHNGMMINIASYLEDQDDDWARQLSIYAWLCGCPVGSDFLVAIDQLACKPNPGGLPSIRIAEHRTRVSNAFQWKTFNRAHHIWELVHSDHFFRHLNKTESKARCAALDQRSIDLHKPSDDPDNWFANATRIL